jgi:putative Holliday junction resolvase
VARVLAIDWGTVRLGLAASDPLGISAQGLKSLRRKGEADDLEAIRDHVERLEVSAVVVGLPRNMDGSLGESAVTAQRFADRLRDFLQLPVHLWDERLTSLAAERVLVDAGVRRKARRGLVDQVAATMILQGFLDRQSAARRRDDP